MKSWPAVRGSAGRVVLAMVAVVVAAGVNACSKPAPTLVAYDPLAPAPGTTPWVRSLLDLPRCRSGAGLATWVVDRLPSLASVSPAAAPALAPVIAETPILLRPPRQVT
ncbi:MAG: hypothetical protein ACRD2W_07615, partial [Acidimicrobiales bacterium]